MGAFLGRPRAAQKPGFPLQVLGFANANPVGFPLQSLARGSLEPAPEIAVRQFQEYIIACGNYVLITRRRQFAYKGSFKNFHFVISVLREKIAVEQQFFPVRSTSNRKFLELPADFRLRKSADRLRSGLSRFRLPQRPAANTGRKRRPAQI
jgi:hypothetical protein